MAGRTRTSAPRGTAGGFTLVELLVSLALMGMASAVLLQCLQMAGVIAQRERSNTAMLEDVIATQRILRSVIEHMRPITRLDSALPIVDARGTEAVFTFIAPPLEQSAPDALQRFRLTRTANGDLVLFSASTRKDGVDRSGTDLIGWTPITLLRGVAVLSMSYRGSARADASQGWQTRWWDRPRPPDLVRIRIGFAPGDRRLWPELIVRPRATTNAACKIDALTGHCEERS